jgi:hypothetical protein
LADLKLWQPNPQRAYSAAGESSGPVLAFFLTWSIIIILAVVTVRAVRPPAPEPATAPDHEFSAERAMIHVREIARVSHPIGSSSHDAVKDYLLAQLAQLGLEPRVFSSIGIDPTAQLVIGGRTQDIIGRVAGSAGGPAIMLMAHYDSVAHAQGAADDGSGVASILEAVRALRRGPPLKRDLIVLFTDGEEAGLLGAEAFAHSHPWMKDVGLIMNFEARGSRGPSLLFETSVNNQPLVEAVATAAPNPIGSSLFYELYKLLPNDTDFTVFRPLRVPGLNFAFGEGLDGYHTSRDTPGNLSAASLQHDGSYGIALTRYFGQSDLADLKKPKGDDIFFDWFGSNLVVYSQRWVLPGEAFVTILLVLALLFGIRRLETRPGKLLLALLGCLGLLLVIPLVVTAGWWVVKFFLAGRMIFSDSPANLFLLCGLMLLGAWAGAIGVGALRRRFSTRELSFAGLILWWILSWLLALWLPSGSYLLFWPLLLATAGIVVHQLVNRVAEPPNQWIYNLAGAGVAVLLFAPVVYLLYIFLTFQLLTVAAAGLLLALFFLISFPLMEANVAVRSRLVFASLLVAAAACLVTGNALSHYTPEHPRLDTIVYSLNADDNTAVWISYDPQIDGWTKQFLTDKPQAPHSVPNYLAGQPRRFLSAGTPVVQLSAPVIENVDHRKDGNTHTLKLTLRSTRNAQVLYLKFGDDVRPVSLRLAGRDVPVHTGGRFGVTLYGIGEKGIDLEIAVSTTSPLSFWVMDRSLGLPVSTQPRPDNIVGADGSDVTFVCRKYTL